MPKLEVVNANNVIEFNPQKANFKLKNTGGPKGEPGERGPQGPKGDTGAQGPAGASASVTVGSTTTLSPGAGATVTNSGDTRNAILNFGIPTGARGPKGDTGSKGDTGPMGPRGAKGDTGAAATVQVGNTNTGAPGTNANVENVGNEHNAILNFTIPRGDKGETGSQGPQGIQGPAGQNGTDGFSPIATVTQEGLDAEISITDKDGTTTATVPGFGVQVVESLPTTGSSNVIYLERDSNSASGNPISIADAVEAPLKSLEIQGNTSQQTYTGKNLMNTYSFVGKNGAGTLTVSADGVLTLTGNTNSNGWCGINKDGTTLKDLAPSLVAGNTYYLYLQGENLARTHIYFNGSTTQWSHGQAHTITQAELDNFVVIYGGYNTTTKFKIMVTTALDGTYERYVGGVPAPNPDYPQAVQTVTGENVVKINGKNLFDIGASLNEWFQTFSNGLTINSYSVNRTTATISGGKLTVDSYDTTGWTWISKWVLLEKNTNYIISGKNTQAMRIVGFNSKELSTAGTLIVVKNKAPDGGTATFDTGDYNYYAISFYPNGANDYFEDIQIEKGSTATIYEPYQGQSYEVNLGKNLFDKDNANTLAGTISSSTVTTGGSNKLLYIKCDPNTTYTVQKRNDGDTNRFAVCSTQAEPVTNVPTSNFSQNNDANVITVTTTSTARYLVVMYYRVQESLLTEQQLLDSIQIELGSQATSYAAYFTPIELCKIGTYQDYIYKSGSKWYVHKECGKMVLNGTGFDWALTSSAAGYVRGQSESIGFPTFSGFCDKLKVRTGSHGSYEYVWFQQGDTGRIYLQVEASRLSGLDLSDFENWLNANTPIAYATLLTPTDTEITNEALVAQLEAILAGGTRAGANTIALTPSAGATGTLEVEYYDSYDSYLWVNNRWEKFAHLG